ncbi:MAG: DUF1844 domain-containing protein [Terriglobia bacterium]
MPEGKKSDEPAGEEVKIVDRRRFTSAGERRPGVAAEPDEPRSVGAPPAPEPSGDVAQAREPHGSGQAASREAEKSYERRRPRHEPKMDFRTLLLSLSTSAMYQLGLVGDPNAPPPPPDFDAARQTIDMIAVLEEKTRNNLSSDEKQLLQQVLYELRMAYVGLGRK